MTFMKDAGVNSTEDLEEALPIEKMLESENGPTEPKLKKPKDGEAPISKPPSESKKTKRLQKNAVKVEEAKHRCDKASFL
jgi:hypothetical protein